MNTICITLFIGSLIKIRVISWVRNFIFKNISLVKCFGYSNKVVIPYKYILILHNALGISYNHHKKFGCRIYYENFKTLISFR